MRKHYAEFIFILILLATTVFLISSNAFFHVDNSRLLVDWPEVGYNEGWTTIDSEGNASPLTDFSRKALRNEAGIVLENRLPDELYKFTVFSVYTYSEKMRVWIDDEEIFNYGWHDETPFGKGFGGVLQLVSIPVDAAGKTLRVELIPQTSFTSAGDYEFHLCSRGSMIFLLLFNNLFLIVNGIFLLLAAVLLISVGILMLSRRESRSTARIYLGIFILIELIWSGTDSNLLQLFFKNKAFLYMLNYASFILGPAPLALCVASFLPQYRRRYHLYALLCCSNLIVCFGIYAMGWLDLYSLLPVAHVLLAIFSVDAIVCCIRNRENNPVYRVMLGIAVCLSSALVSLALFYFLKRSKALFWFNYQSVGTLGLDFLVITVYISLLHMSVSGHQLQTLANHLQEEVYLDKMTGLHNRTAFEARVSELHNQTESILSLFMIDLNNLKIVNDTMGHRWGDTLICALSNCLKAAFNENGEIYRYGGDEFVVICPDCDAEMAILLHAKLRNELESTRKRGQCLIDVAIGYAVRDSENHPGMPFSLLLKLADSDMYEVKRREKTSDLRYMDVQEQFWMNRIDPATGLMTFSAFRQRMQSHLYDFPQHKWAVLNFDVAGFSSYNACFGWDAGDLLLKKIADLTLMLCCKDGFCAHGEADNFWILVNYDNPENVSERLELGKNQFKQLVGDINLQLRIGIYPIDDLNLHVGEMCSRANADRRANFHRDDSPIKERTKISPETV